MKYYVYSQRGQNDCDTIYFVEDENFVSQSCQVNLVEGPFDTKDEAQECVERLEKELFEFLNE